jgi:hypothetical protein
MAQLAGTARLALVAHVAAAMRETWASVVRSLLDSWWARGATDRVYQALDAFDRRRAAWWLARYSALDAEAQRAWTSAERALELAAPEDLEVVIAMLPADDVVLRAISRRVGHAQPGLAERVIDREQRLPTAAELGNDGALIARAATRVDPTAQRELLEHAWSLAAIEPTLNAVLLATRSLRAWERARRVFCHRGSWGGWQPVVRAGRPSRSSSSWISSSDGLGRSPSARLSSTIQGERRRSAILAPPTRRGYRQRSHGPSRETISAPTPCTMRCARSRNRPAASTRRSSAISHAPYSAARTTERLSPTRRRTCATSSARCHRDLRPGSSKCRRVTNRHVIRLIATPVARRAA